MFVRNHNRRTVWDGFKQFLEHIQSLSDLNRIYVDGGFVTDSIKPEDIDIVIEYPDGATRQRLRDTYWFLRRRERVAHRYKVDVLDCLLNEPPPTFIEFFQLLRPEEATKRGLPPGSEKGILRISLR